MGLKSIYNKRISLRNDHGLTLPDKKAKHSQTPIKLYHFHFRSLKAL